MKYLDIILIIVMCFNLIAIGYASYYFTQENLQCTESPLTYGLKHLRASGNRNLTCTCLIDNANLDEPYLFITQHNQSIIRPAMMMESSTSFDWDTINKSLMGIN